MSGEPWSPGLTDVARHIPTRTRDSKAVGKDTLLMTFSQNTTPTDDQVQQLIDDTLGALEAQIGDIPSVLTQHPDLAIAMRVYVEWRTAADIEVAYPNRDADIQVYAQLDARAKAAYAVVAAALAVEDVGSTALVPQWAFPDSRCTPYPDESPGSGAEQLIGRRRFLEF